MVVTFCGHGDAPQSEELKSWLHTVVERQIQQGASCFLLGGYGSFDLMAAGVVWELKRQYPHIESTLVLPYLDRKVDASRYDGTIYPPLENVPPRYAISRRNRWIVDSADVLIAYVCHSWGGAATTLNYAKRKHKIIIQYGST
jgi:hypothetical protein